MYKVQNKEERGITLVALIITVIILVILAAVTITAVTNMSIISTAKRGAEDYLRGGQEENDLFNITAGILNEVIKGNGSSGVGGINEPEDAGLTLTQLASDYIGAYVNYENYVNAKESKPIYTSGTYNGNDANLSWTRQDLTWRILDVNTTTNKVKLIATTPDTRTLTLKGYTGYNNAVGILNKICAQCYSSSTLNVTARSINIEDIENCGSTNKPSKKTSPSYTTSLSDASYAPTISQYETYQWPLSGTGTTHYLERSKQYSGGGTSGVGDTIAESNWFANSDSAGRINISSGYKFGHTYYSYSLSNFDNTATSPYRAIFSNSTEFTTTANNPTVYWIASRCVFCNSYYAFFDVFSVSSSDLGAYGLYYSSGNSYSIAFAVRPVVEIPLTSISITADAIHDGSTGAKALQIRK